ncbi:MAG: TonB-dependent receptor domain-containing protein, partial [Gammaproteobacteria bacterium]
AYLNSSLLLGQYLDATQRSTAFDLRASRDLMTLPAGPLGFAIGVEHRRDHASYLVNRALASQASSSGYQEALDQFGKRHMSAVFMEANVPVIQNLELNLALRHDRYSDFGGSTNPKVAVRYQPIPQILLRGSYNRGFRAPTLFDINAPETTTNTSDTYNDPLLCPGGVPVAGANPNIACDQQQNIRSGGNRNLQPEKSKTYSAGIVFEPTRELTVALDYWDIRLREQINTLPEQTIFGNYEKYRSLYFYNAAGTRLDYVLATVSNLGEVRTRGVDASLNYRMPRTPWGTPSLILEGTYVNKYDYQNERNGPFTENVGRYADATPVFRWRHNLLLSWASGPWSANLGNRFMTGYTDQNAVDPQFFRKVSHYSTWSLAGMYGGRKNVTYTLGVKNLTDKEPPYTNQGTTFQQGYDPRYTDPVGRTWYARIATKF